MSNKLDQQDRKVYLRLWHYLSPHRPIGLIVHHRLWYQPVELVFDTNQNLQWIDALHAKLPACTAQELA